MLISIASSLRSNAARAATSKYTLSKVEGDAAKFINFKGLFTPGVLDVVSMLPDRTGEAIFTVTLNEAECREALDLVEGSRISSVFMRKMRPERYKNKVTSLKKAIRKIQAYKKANNIALATPELLEANEAKAVSAPVAQPSASV